MRVLAIAATLASAAAFAPTSLPRVRRSAATTTMAAKSKLGVGIIGCGRIGLVHLDTLAGLDFASPVIVGDFFVDVAEKVSKQYGVPEFCKEASDVRIPLLALSLLPRVRGCCDDQLYKN